MSESASPDAKQPTHEEIAQRAYAKYLARGAEGYGFDLQDWFEAEAELRGPISTASQEAAVRGAEAEAAQEKREAEIGGDLPAEARALMTDVGASIPRRGRSAGRDALASKAEAPGDTAARTAQPGTAPKARTGSAAKAGGASAEPAVSSTRRGRATKRDSLVSTNISPNTREEGGQNTTTDVDSGGNAAPDDAALLTDVGDSIPRKGRSAGRGALSSKTDIPASGPESR